MSARASAHVTHFTCIVLFSIAEWGFQVLGRGVWLWLWLSVHAQVVRVATGRGVGCTEWPGHCLW